MQLPVRFGKYELQQFLGGGMSHVFRSLDTVIGRQVAVKILTDQACMDEDSKQRFLNEARMSGAIQHDNIVTVYDYGEIEGRPFIVMEMLAGRDLRDTLRNNLAGDLPNRLRIATEVALALEYVHQKSIIHRDIKPENIFIEKSGRSKLMDFGISKTIGINLTKDGTAIGTPHYMAPEQVMGGEMTPRVDVYCFGIVLYELLTGERLINGDNMERLFYLILHENPKVDVMQAAGLPQSAIDLVVKCCAKKPEDRLQNFTQVHRHLLAIQSELRHGPGHATAPTEAHPVARPAAPVARVAPAAVAAKSSSNLMPLLLIGGIAVVAVAIAAMVYFSGQKPVAETAGAKKQTAEKPASVLAKGGQMLLVPAGVFQFGSGHSPVKMPDFYMDRTEVSNQAYREFATATSRPLPEGLAASAPDLPVVNVTFNDAKDFCTWAGKHLPSENEWEKAARGEDGREYPWGNNPDALRANVADNAGLGGKALAPADSMPSGASPFQMVNMTGNAWEWVEHPHTPSAQAVQSFATALKPSPTAKEPWHYIRGGAFDRKLAEGVTYEWSSAPARLAGPTIGFRCAAEPPVGKP